MRTAFALLLTLAAAPALAQVQPPAPQPGEELWDGVVAVVGDTALLRSDVLLAMEAMRAEGQPVPTDPAEYGQLVQQLVSERVNDLLLLEGARAAGETVNDAEVAAAVEDQIRQVRERFGSEAAYAQALAEAGRTPEGYRAGAGAPVRRPDAGAALRPPAHDGDGAAGGDATRRSAPSSRPTAPASARARPPSRSSRCSCVPCPATRRGRRRCARPRRCSRSWARAREFEVLARRYGTDGTRERGGDLGWFRQGQMVREFDQVVFAMRPGQTSGIVETEFGFHVIKLEKVRGPERQARHILIRPEITQADIDRGAARGPTPWPRPSARGAQAQELAARYNTPDALRFQAERAAGPLAAGVPDGAGRRGHGDGGGPHRSGGRPHPGVRGGARDGPADSGEYTVDDQRERIREVIREQRLMQRLIEELRRDMYVSIRL